MELLNSPGIAEFFFGRSIFITGATGFMGKVMVEKLLRSCPGIVKIYALVRPGRNGEAAQEKLNKMFELPLFDRIKVERPGDLESKLIAVEGDMTELNLGLSMKDRAILTKEVSVVYNIAAVVRFDQALQAAIIMNVRGTREVCELVQEIRKNTPDTILMHVSTAYAHTDQKSVEERMYPAHANWQRSIQIAEGLERDTIQILSDKYMDGFPNTYTFTKSMAEHVVNDLCGQGGCTLIIRPSIVISTVKEPIKGWIDNFNGPVAMFAALGTGIVRISYMKPDITADYMAVDCGIKAIIVATYRQELLKRAGTADLQVAEVYNCTSYDTKAVTMLQMSEMAISLASEVPIKDSLWYPSGSTTSNLTWYYINFMLFHMVPAVIVDAANSVLKMPIRSLVRVQRKLYTATMALSYFIGNDWSFVNKKTLALENIIQPHELEIFGYDVDNIDNMDFFRHAMLGGKKYLLKESLDNLEHEKIKLNIFYYLDRLCSISSYGLSLWLIFVKWNIPGYFYSRFLLYIENL